MPEHDDRWGVPGCASKLDASQPAQVANGLTYRLLKYDEFRLVRNRYEDLPEVIEVKGGSVSEVGGRLLIKGDGVTHSVGTVVSNVEYLYLDLTTGWATLGPYAKPRAS